MRPSTPPCEREGRRPPVEDLEDRYRVDIAAQLKSLSLHEGSPPSHTC